jgi:hypothetical protein
MKKKLSLFVGAAAFAALAVAPLNADPVSVCVGYNGGSCTTVATGNGSASYSTTSNPDYQLLVAAGSGTPSNPEPTLALTTLNTTSMISSATQLTVELTETGITTPVSPLSFTQSMAATLGPGIKQITFANYISNSNNAYDTSGTVLGTYNTSTSGATATNSSGPVTFTTPFSETEVINIYFSGSGESAQAQDMITGTPEPMSLGLLGSGFAALGILRWRKSRKA